MTALNATAGIARLSRRLISISGPEGAKFLQGMLSAAVLTRDGGVIPGDVKALYSGFFTPQGRVLHDVLVYPRPPRDAAQPTPDYLVEVDGAEAAKLVKRLKFYKLRAKFDMRILDPSESSVYHLWDDAGASGLAELEGKVDGTIRRDPRLAALGYRVLATGDKAPQVGVEEVGEDAYRLRRYMHGIPEDQAEIPLESAMPLEYNMEVLGGIDFHKGCYVGQELQARTKYLGVVQKRILPCVLYEGDAAPETLEYTASDASTGVANGTDIEKVRKEGEVASRRDRKPGKWIAGVGNVGLGLCRLSVMTGLEPPHPPDMPIKMVFSPGDEFSVKKEDGGALKVKAFVPEWLREGLKGYRN